MDERLAQRIDAAIDIERAETVQSLQDDAMRFRANAQHCAYHANLLRTMRSENMRHEAMIYDNVADWNMEKAQAFERKIQKLKKSAAIKP